MPDSFTNNSPADDIKFIPTEIETTENLDSMMITPGKISAKLKASDEFVHLATFYVELNKNLRELLDLKKWKFVEWKFDNLPTRIIERNVMQPISIHKNYLPDNLLFIN